MKNIKLNLNEIYLPLIQKRDEFIDILQSGNFKYKSLFCNNHYAKDGDNFLKELYPIPVVEVKGVGDFVFDLDNVSFEGYFLKNDLLKFDLNGILRKFKDKDLCFYGETDYLVDLYSKDDDLSTLLNNLKKSKDNKIAINFSVSKPETDFKILINLLKKT